MHSRRAKRLATQRLAAFARLLASQADQLDELDPADQARMMNAYDDLGRELEVRAGVTPHAVKRPPVDPDQAALFAIDQEEQDHDIRSEGAG